MILRIRARRFAALSIAIFPHPEEGAAAYGMIVGAWPAA